ncbi:unnamed protein product [Haemonchus placei]|uniref:Activin_recp domain-containing protein n=1 Tax=Haemonchus placei TaxID=6290 RepID=A0A0N4X9A4_HAEPC|nr:unnamed protein product [Haemonchus placei]
MDNYSNFCFLPPIPSPTTGEKELPQTCLMLDHPTLGIHYTCHNKLQKDGFCREKTSKSGALVKICGCNSDDFCNYSYWPDKIPRELQMSRPLESSLSIHLIFSFYVLYVMSLLYILEYVPKRERDIIKVPDLRY